MWILVTFILVVLVTLALVVSTAVHSWRGRRRRWQG